MMSVTQAQESFFLGNFNSYANGSLHGQDNWSLTKYYPDEVGEINITTSETASEEKFAEIINEKSLIVTKSDVPKDAGTIEFKMRHNKVGQFYFYAQTSDNGGQLLFSIQFTPTAGILLEESGRQVTLLPEYNSDQWYTFTIDFDNARGDNGTFTVTIDDVAIGEYAYVNSESTLFDLAQITFGSESSDGAAISAFAGTFSAVLPQATSTVSADLLQLSISLSSTSISSNLENGLIVTASLDGIASVATSSISADQNAATSNATTTKTPPSEPESFIEIIIDSFLELFTPEAEPIPVEPILPVAIPLPPEPTEPELVVPEPELALPEPEPVVPTEEIISNEPQPENEVQSVLSIDETTNEINTVEF